MRTLHLPVLLALGLSLTSCVTRTDPVTGKSGLSFYSDEDEIAIGNSAAPSMEQQSGGLYRDPALEAYVASVGARLASASDRKGMPYRYRVLNSGILNAFALPGGHIYITRGLLTRLGSENELAAVLGHETGHVAARHGIKHMEFATGVGVLLDLGARAAARTEDPTNAQAGLKVARIVAGLGSLKYSRDDERQADHLGITYAERAGWDPRGMLGLMKVLQSSETSEPSAIEGLLRTHPLTSERIRNAESELAGRDAASMARLAKSSPEFDKRIAALRDADKAQQKHDKARELMGRAQSMRGGPERTTHLKQAYGEVEEALKMTPDQAPFHTTRSWIILLAASQQKLAQEDAQRGARRALELDPGLYEGHLLLGVTGLSLGDLSAARGSLRRAEGLWPDNAAAPYYLGLLSEREGKREEAAGWFQKTVDLDPSGAGYGRGAADGLKRLGTAP